MRSYPLPRTWLLSGGAYARGGFVKLVFGGFEQFFENANSVSDFLALDILRTCEYQPKRYDNFSSPFRWETVRVWAWSINSSFHEE